MPQGRPPTRGRNRSAASGRAPRYEAGRAAGDDHSSEERFRLVAEATSDVIWDWDIQAGTLWWSPSVATIFGYGAAEVEGRVEWWARHIHPEDHEHVMARVNAALASDKPNHRDEYRFQRRDGEYATVVGRARIVRDAEGRPVRMVGAMVDVSERRRQEAERERLTRQHSDLARTACLVNSARSLDETLADITHAAREIIGAHQAVTSLTTSEEWSQAIHTVSLSDKYAAWRDYDEIPTGTGIYRVVCEHNQTMRLTHDELQRHPAFKGFGASAERHPPMRGWLAVALKDRSGRNMGLIQLSDRFEGDFTPADEAVLEQLAQLTSIAIENSRLIEAAHRHADELEERVEERTARLREANRQLELFVSAVSHDLRAPLRHVVGFVAALEEAEGPHIGAESAGYLRRIGEAARRMRGLIDDLLMLSRTSQAALERRDVNLDEMIRRLRSEQSALAGDRRVEWEIAPLPPVHGDPGLLEVAFGNLLSNAMKYTARCPVAHIGICAQRAPTGHVVVSVRDDGVGFDPRFAGNLFGIFQRLHSDADLDGTGIGLAMVREIVQKQGGSVWAEGTPGVGATFYVALQEARGERP